MQTLANRTTPPTHSGLVAFLNNHSVSYPLPTVVAVEPSGIRVRTWVSKGAAVECELVEEIIPPTFAAARDWLGY